VDCDAISPMDAISQRPHSRSAEKAIILIRSAWARIGFSLRDPGHKQINTPSTFMAIRQDLERDLCGSESIMAKANHR
jgi:hypothetical protein